MLRSLVGSEMCIRDREGDYSCAVCLQLLYQPVSTACGHNFCRGCLRRLTNSQNSFKTQCPLCRASISVPSGYKPNKLLDQLLQHHFPQAYALSKEEQSQRVWEKPQVSTSATGADARPPAPPMMVGLVMVSISLAILVCAMMATALCHAALDGGLLVRTTLELTKAMKAGNHTMAEEAVRQFLEGAVFNLSKFKPFFVALNL
eukprot:TRINITY_DN23087_c0_g1_i4.p1 TRINITY_DN23087_c0_g1~~TRINITY_DN23087_c0_g1_i4.p1  ORF type:complete len:203 (+),score=53.16 TRINITY_DN23087_c0_g1_i4:103-711(+)